jgi:hypothetical protein
MTQARHPGNTAPIVPFLLTTYASQGFSCSIFCVCAGYDMHVSTRLLRLLAVFVQGPVGCVRINESKVFSKVYFTSISSELQ